MKNILLLLLTSNMLHFNFSPFKKPMTTVATVSQKTLVDAKRYYFSSTMGNDSYTIEQAQDPKTPWRSISKLNSMMVLFNNGDSILLKRGEIFTGTIVFVKGSGSTNNPIVLSAYGNGEPPIITGLARVKKWNQVKGNLWQTVCSEFDTVSNVFVNGKQQSLGRFPNIESTTGGYITIASHEGKIKITSGDKLETDWTGAEMVVRDKRWILDRTVITSQRENTFTLSGTITYEPINGFGFFIQNHLNTLDQDGEWFYNHDKRLLYIYTLSDPNQKEINISVVPELIKLQPGASNLVLENISLDGAARNAIQLDKVINVAIRNMKITNTCMTALYASSSRKLSFENSKITNVNNDGINFQYCDDVFIKKNSIKNIGLRAGMGIGSHHHYSAMQLLGSGYHVLQNDIDSIGYLGIYFSCEKILIKNNFISNFCFVKDDGGGIYTFSSINNLAHNQEIVQNIIMNGKGASQGTPYHNPFASGVYLDDNSSNTNIQNNTILNCSQSGIYVRNSKDIKISNNTLYNNLSQIRFAHDTTSNTFSNTNCEVYDNILVSASRGQHGITISTIDDYSNNINLSNRNNYYHPPGDSNCVILEYYRKNIFTVDVLPLSAWKRKYHADVNSTSTSLLAEPVRIDSLIGDNLIKHEDLKKINEWTSWSPVNNSKIEIDASKRHLGVGLKLSFTSIKGGADTKLYAFANSFSVEGGKYYALYFSAKSSVPGIPLVVDLRKAEKPNDILDEPGFFRLDTAVTNYWHIFKAHYDQPFTRLDFNVMEGNHAVWLGNVELREANITLADTVNILRLEFNSDMNAKILNLTRLYKDALNIRLKNSILIPPYSSVLLFKDTLPNVLCPIDLNIVKKVPLLLGKKKIYYSLALLAVLTTVLYICIQSKRKVILRVAVFTLIIVFALGIIDALNPYRTDGTIHMDSKSVTIAGRTYLFTDLSQINVDIQGYEGQQTLPYRSSPHRSTGLENSISVKTKHGNKLTCQFKVNYYSEIRRIKKMVDYWKLNNQNAELHIAIDWI